MFMAAGRWEVESPLTTESPGCFHDAGAQTVPLSADLLLLSSFSVKRFFWTSVMTVSWEILAYTALHWLRFEMPRGSAGVCWQYGWHCSAILLQVLFKIRALFMWFARKKSTALALMATGELDWATFVLHLASFPWALPAVPRGFRRTMVVLLHWSGQWLIVLVLVFWNFDLELNTGSSESWLMIRIWK